MASPGQVARLLSQVRYRQPDVVDRQVTHCLTCNRGLSPLLDTFVSNDGQVVHLLCLRGTVPIEYRGGKYHIPVSIWLPELYPAQPPMVYVTPTAEMRIKPNHGAVDMQGHVYIEYLHMWNRAQSTLVELTSQLSIVFSNDPPVYRYNPNQPQPSPQPRRTAP